MSYETLCMNCMQEKGNAEQCPHCHFHNDSLQLPPYLPMRTLLGQRYLVGAVQTSNGDGATYIGYDTVENIPITIREFLPDAITKRSSDSNDLQVNPGRENEYHALLSSFLDMWGKLVRMRGLSALISVNTILEENNTAYAIAEHVEGAQSLRDYLLSTKDGYLSWKTARVMFMPVLSTLATLHSAGIIHRGISPSTLYVYPDHKLRIAGFSIPECRTVNGGLTTEVFPGYSPVELLGVQSATGPWTDIYSFAAVLYRALTGRVPMDAMVRMQDDTMVLPAQFAEQLPDYVINALVNALQVLPEDRTRSIDRFRAELSSSQVAEFASEYEQEEKARKRERFSHAADPNHLDDTQTIGGPNSSTMRFNIPSQESAPSMEDPEEEEKRRRSAKKKKLSPMAGSNTKTILLTVAIVLLAAALITIIVLAATGFLGSGGGRVGDATTASLENGEILVPNFVGQSYDDLSFSDRSNFNIQVKYDSGSTSEDGTILAQSIQPNQMVPKGTTITLTVARASDQVQMPSVVGETAEQARASLESRGFSVNVVQKSNDGSHTSGTVAETNLTAGRSYDRGTSVTLVVWGESSYTTAESDNGQDSQNVYNGFGNLYDGN